MTEVRITDEVTGGQKGQKPERFDLIPPAFLWQLAQLYGKGAEKYEDRNWEKGYAWGLSYAALQRHINQWRMGESYDEETGCHHLIAATFHLAALHHFEEWQKGTDDLNRKQS